MLPQHPFWPARSSFTSFSLLSSRTQEVALIRFVLNSTQSFDAATQGFMIFPQTSCLKLSASKACCRLSTAFNSWTFAWAVILHANATKYWLQNEYMYVGGYVSGYSCTLSSSLMSSIYLCRVALFLCVYQRGFTQLGQSDVASLP